MSIERINEVFARAPADLTAGEMLVLLALANFENGRTGQLNPSVQSIATIARTNLRQTRRYLASLRARGLLPHAGKGGRHASNQYVISLPGNPVTSDTLSEQETLSDTTPFSPETLPHLVETLPHLVENPVRSDTRSRRTRKNQKDIGGVGDEEVEDLASPLPRKRLTKPILEELRGEYFDLDVDEELTRFRNYPRQNPLRDQVLAFRNWLKKARSFKAKPHSNGRYPRPQRKDLSTQEDRDVLERLSR